MMLKSCCFSFSYCMRVTKQAYMAAFCECTLVKLHKPPLYRKGRTVEFRRGGRGLEFLEIKILAQCENNKFLQATCEILIMGLEVFPGRNYLYHMLCSKYYLFHIFNISTHCHVANFIYFATVRVKPVYFTGLVQIVFI